MKFNFEKTAQLLNALLPFIETGIALHVHNAGSQGLYNVIFGEVNTVAAAAAAIAAAEAPKQ